MVEAIRRDAQWRWTITIDAVVAAISFDDFGLDVQSFRWRHCTFRGNSPTTMRCRIKRAVSENDEGEYVGRDWTLGRLEFPVQHRTCHRTTGSQFGVAQHDRVPWRVYLKRE